MKNSKSIVRFDAFHFLQHLKYDLDELADSTPSIGLAYASKRFSNRLLKKYCPTGSSNKIADQTALDKFMHINSNQNPINMDPEVIGEARDFIWSVLERGTRLLSPRVGSVSPQQVLDLPTVFSMWKIGTGSNAGSKFSHFCEKMTESTMSSTLRASAYRGYLAYVSPDTFAPQTNEGCCVIGVSTVRGSQLSFVPKTPDVSRIIATEPIINMCCQLAAGNFIASSLKLVGLHIDKQQPRNKRLAELGSIVGDGLGCRLTTLDLESASDRITPELVKLLLPPEWYHFLMSIRSEYADVPKTGSVKLSMMSTMGNGFTFALMTLINTSLVYAVNRIYLGSKRNAIDWTSNAIYGDDIIVRNEIANIVVDTLESCGLAVNYTKSYDTGYFRESCGGDYYNGFDVTPVYIKSLVTKAERVTALNQLLGWCRRNNVRLPCIDGLLAHLRSIGVGYVPMWEADYAGVKIPTGSGPYTALQFVREPTPMERDGSALMSCVLGGYVSSNRRPHIDGVENPEYGMYYTTRDAVTILIKAKVPCVIAWAGDGELSNAIMRSLNQQPYLTTRKAV